MIGSRDASIPNVMRQPLRKIMKTRVAPAICQHSFGRSWGQPWRVRTSLHTLTCIHVFQQSRPGPTRQLLALRRSHLEVVPQAQKVFMQQTVPPPNCCHITANDQVVSDSSNGATDH
jgi:hypothetical protein